MFSHMFLDSRSPAYQAQIRMQTELHWVALMTGAFLILLAILLLISGLKLVRSQPDGTRGRTATPGPPSPRNSSRSPSPSSGSFP
jgi:hypothetical protein